MATFTASIIQTSSECAVSELLKSVRVTHCLCPVQLKLKSLQAPDQAASKRARLQLNNKRYKNVKKAQSSIIQEEWSPASGSSRGPNLADQIPGLMHQGGMIKTIKLVRRVKRPIKVDPQPTQCPRSTGGGIQGNRSKSSRLQKTRPKNFRDAPLVTGCCTLSDSRSTIGVDAPETWQPVQCGSGSAHSLAHSYWLTEPRSWTLCLCGSEPD
nr:hypothetical protein MACL_00001841 [Theileria orientalis]